MLSKILLRKIMMLNLWIKIVKLIPLKFDNGKSLYKNLVQLVVTLPKKKKKKLVVTSDYNSHLKH